MSIDWILDYFIFFSSKRVITESDPSSSFASRTTHVLRTELSNRIACDAQVLKRKVDDGIEFRTGVYVISEERLRLLLSRVAAQIDDAKRCNMCLSEDTDTNIVQGVALDDIPERATCILTMDSETGNYWIWPYSMGRPGLNGITMDFIPKASVCDVRLHFRTGNLHVRVAGPGGSP